MGVAPAGALAAPGDLDPAFGQGGIFNSPHQTDSGEASLDQDGLGRPLVSWTFRDGSQSKLVVARLTTGGALDTTFNAGGPTPGLVVVDFTERLGANVQAAGVAASPGGTVVATGIMAIGTFSQEIALVRLTSTGGYDNSFSGDGRLVTKVSEVYDAPLDVAVDGPGKKSTRLNS